MNASTPPTERLKEEFSDKFDNAVGACRMISYYVTDADVLIAFEKENDYCMYEGSDQDHDTIIKELAAWLPADEQIPILVRLGIVVKELDAVERFSDASDKLTTELYDTQQMLEQKRFDVLKIELESESALLAHEMNLAKDRTQPLIALFKGIIFDSIDRISASGLVIDHINVGGSFGDLVSDKGTLLKHENYDAHTKRSDINIKDVQCAQRLSIPSVYLYVENAEYDSFKIRFSDHDEVPGGGFIHSEFAENGGSRSGESDISIVIDSYSGPLNEHYDVDLSELDEFITKHTVSISKALDASRHNSLSL